MKTYTQEELEAELLALEAGARELPLHMRDGVRRYVVDGKPVGGFLTSLFAGDLEGAKARADHVNLEAWPTWRAFLAASISEDCHGTPEKVKAWQAAGGLMGLLGEKS